MTESEDPQPIGEFVDEAVLHLMGPEHPAAFDAEKTRHKEEMKNIERIHKLARSRLKRLYGPVKERIEADIEHQYAERTQEEEDRHQTNVAALGKNIRGGIEGQADSGDALPQ